MRKRYLWFSLAPGLFLTWLQHEYCNWQTGFMKQKRSSQPYILLICAGMVFSLSACFKNIPVSKVVYSNDFENNSMNAIQVYNYNGLVVGVNPIEFNGSKVSARFNNNRVVLTINNLPDHNAIKVQFDLLIHDGWIGDYLAPGNTIPDVWSMAIDNNPFIQTTFSNTNYRQSYPANYTGVFPNPPRANAWSPSLPGFCSLAGNSAGTSMYRIEQTTSHYGNTVVISCNDDLHPFGDFCSKSWSLDNITVTAIKYP